MPIGDLHSEADLDAFVAERVSASQANSRALGGFVRFGAGVPSQAPVAGSAIYFRLDGTPGANVYAYTSVAWVAIA